MKYLALLLSHPLPSSGDSTTHGHGANSPAPRPKPSRNSSDTLRRVTGASYFFLGLF